MPSSISDSIQGLIVPIIPSSRPLNLVKHIKTFSQLITQDCTLQASLCTTFYKIILQGCRRGTETESGPPRLNYRTCGYHTGRASEGGLVPSSNSSLFSGDRGKCRCSPAIVSSSVVLALRAVGTDGFRGCTLGLNAFLGKLSSVPKTIH